MQGVWLQSEWVELRFVQGVQLQSEWVEVQTFAELELAVGQLASDQVTYFASVLWEAGGACPHPHPVGLDTVVLWVPESRVGGMGMWRGGRGQLQKEEVEVKGCSRIKG